MRAASGGLRPLDGAPDCPIHVVLDNLCTHSCRALEVGYGVRAGRQLWRQLIALLSRQCLGKRRIPTLDKLHHETDV